MVRFNFYRLGNHNILADIHVGQDVTASDNIKRIQFQQLLVEEPHHLTAVHARITALQLALLRLQIGLEGVERII